MPTRTRKTWNRGRDGQYARQLGWRFSRSSKRTQVKFRLGTDLREAKRREMMLTELWEDVERRANGEPAYWPQEALQVAASIARDGRALVPKRNGEPSTVYANRMLALADRLPGLRFVPEDAEAFREGVASQAKSTDEFVTLYEKTSDALRQRLRERAAKWCDPSSDQPVVGGPTVHDALRDHIVWLKAEYTDADGNLSEWGRVRTKQAELLLDRHDDLPLARLDHDTVEAMVRFWRQRPIRKGSDRPIAKKSAEHQISALKFFVRWLGRSPKYDWKKPESLGDIRTRVDGRADDKRPQITPDDVFSLEELILLNKYATPRERLLLLLGINCGYSRAEIATLRIGEVYLRQAHAPVHQQILNFKSTDEDSFIKRCRPKTGIYGEHILFPQTVEAIEWVLQRRKRHPEFGPNARLLLNDNGQPYDKPTEGGNPNRQIQNRFAGLLRRIEKAGKHVKRRPFKTLRKTAGDLVRRFSDGEVAAVFHCRGQAVKIDNLADFYTTRPFGKVFEAIREMEEYLVPMFEAAGPSPFETERKRGVAAQRAKAKHERQTGS